MFVVFFGGEGEEGRPNNEHTAAVEGHASRAGEIVLLNALLVDQLLGCDVADRKQERRGHGLREERPRREPGLVPG